MNKNEIIEQQNAYYMAGYPSRKALATSKPTYAELEKEAEEYTEKHWGASPSVIRALKQTYLAGAEPREKQIQIDAEQIRALQKQNGELTDKVKKLEEEIADLQLGISIRNEDMEKLEAQIENIKYYLDNEIPHDLINEATTKIWRMLK